MTMDAILEHLPELDETFLLTQEQVDNYQRDGHIRLDALCSRQEIDVYRPLFDEAVMARAGQLAPMEERDVYGQAFIQIMNLWREEEELKRFVFAKRFAEVAATLLGVDKVRLYHDQALFKEAKGGMTPWHQDQHYWPLDTDNTVTLWMPLVDISKSMGSMTFASGSQVEGYLGDLPISTESNEQLEAFVRDRGYSTHNYGTMTAGDATFHSGWVLHGAPPNNATTTREVMTIIYYPNGTPVLKPDNENRQLDLDSWIPEGIPGEPAASKLNPILFSRT